MDLIAWEVAISQTLKSVMANKYPSENKVRFLTIIYLCSEKPSKEGIGKRARDSAPSAGPSKCGPSSDRMAPGVKAGRVGLGLGYISACGDDWSVVPKPIRPTKSNANSHFYQRFPRIFEKPSERSQADAGTVVYNHFSILSTPVTRYLFSNHDRIYLQARHWLRSRDIAGPQPQTFYWRTAVDTAYAHGE